MNKTLLAMCAAVSVLGVSACAEGYHGANYAYGGAPDVWYDGYYGDYTDGYWGPDTAFYYRDHDGHFTRDSGNHFRHERFEGARGVRAGHAPDVR